MQVRFTYVQNSIHLQLNADGEYNIKTSNALIIIIIIISYFYNYIIPYEIVYIISMQRKQVFQSHHVSVQRQVQAFEQQKFFHPLFLGHQ